MRLELDVFKIKDTQLVEKTEVKEPKLIPFPV
jgi:hypothetical protein